MLIEIYCGRLFLGRARFCFIIGRDWRFYGVLVGSLNRLWARNINNDSSFSGGIKMSENGKLLFLRVHSATHTAVARFSANFVHVRNPAGPPSNFPRKKMSGPPPTKLTQTSDDHTERPQNVRHINTFKLSLLFHASSDRSQKPGEKLSKYLKH